MGRAGRGRTVTGGSVARPPQRWPRGGAAPRPAAGFAPPYLIAALPPRGPKSAPRVQYIRLTRIGEGMRGCRGGAGGAAGPAGGGQEKGGQRKEAAGVGGEPTKAAAEGGRAKRGRAAVVISKHYFSLRRGRLRRPSDHPRCTEGSAQPRSGASSARPCSASGAASPLAGELARRPTKGSVDFMIMGDGSGYRKIKGFQFCAGILAHLVKAEAAKGSGRRSRPDLRAAGA